jgi:amidophosphoribosyltransferase
MKKSIVAMCIFLLYFPSLCHSCGIAAVRLRQPIAYYAERYEDPAWGVKKLLFLLEKQRNRGQDGTGISIVQFQMPSCKKYFHTLKSADPNSLDQIARQVLDDLKLLNSSSHSLSSLEWKSQSPYIGEVLLGHLRYATHSGLQLKHCQPFIRPHYIPKCQLALAGNFNMTNTDELLQNLETLGFAFPMESDTQVILDKISYELDRDNEPKLEIASILKKAAKEWDGGYLFSGALGNGDLFVLRDPAGIRPGYYFVNEEVVAVASEKGALIETFDITEKEISSIKPGHALIIKQEGEISEVPILDPLPERQCCFERIYFSKANDPEIYQERKMLGRNLAAKVFEALGNNLEHTIFTFVPNSSISAFQGLVEGISELNQVRSKILPRIEYIIAKNQKVRTFISSDLIRNSLISELYEVTKGVVTSEDTLVVIDDSIVRGATLQNSLIPKLLRLKPKKIIIVSSAPPVLYPDCYGIDMSQLGKFIAFQAAVEILKDKGEEKTLTALYQGNGEAVKNPLHKMYHSFNMDELSQKIATLISPPSCTTPIQVIYQSLEGLHSAMPNFTGDWYFTGEYPTPGGYKVLQNSLLKWHLKDPSRSY